VVFWYRDSLSLLYPFFGKTGVGFSEQAPVFCPFALPHFPAEGTKNEKR